MHMAFYKGPAPNLEQKIIHTGICLVTASPYSHCEIVIDDWCYSSSPRDGGVRRKQIDLNSGKWDLLDINYSPEYALQVFEATKGLPYDWPGAFRHLIPFLPNSKDKWYCSEWCAYALGMFDFEHTPASLRQYLFDNATLGPGLPIASMDWE